MTRPARLDAIRRLVHNHEVSSQTQLVELLAEEGFQATQATVSRDIRHLGLVKLASEHGGVRYATPDAMTSEAAGAHGSFDGLRSLFQRSVVSVEDGAALLVLRTPAGFANAVAARLDGLDRPELVGTLAGDDTVLLVLRSARDRASVREALSELIA